MSTRSDKSDEDSRYAVPHEAPHDVLHDILYDTLYDALHNEKEESTHFTPPYRVAVACSGGADSMALLHSLCVLIEDMNALHRRPVHIVPVMLTVDHQLHELSSSHTEGVYTYWTQRGIEAYILYADIELIKGGAGVEEGARQARYKALEDSAQTLKLDLILTAHHAYDQVETMLMRLQTSSGVRGLGGIPARRGQFLRPWLSQSPALLISLGRAAQLPIFEDPTNTNERFLRNRIRAQLLPILDQVFEEGWAERTHQTARHIRAQWSGADYFIQSMLRTHIVQRTWSVELDWVEGLNAPLDAQELVIYRCLTQAFHSLIPSTRDVRRVKDHIDRIRTLWSGKQRRTIELPLSLFAWGGGGRLKIYDPRQIPLPPSSPVKIDGLGTYEWGPWRVHFIPSSEGTDLSNTPYPWSLRTPYQGERFRSAGSSGSKKIRKIWSDLKCPPFECSTLPILSDLSDEVMWVPYRPIAHHLYVKDLYLKGLKQTSAPSTAPHSAAPPSAAPHRLMIHIEQIKTL